MGLAGNKEKQRISADPNNLTWSNDQSKFGFKMLQMMGWSPGKGLGVNEDGNQEHVKIKLKDDTLGLGASKKTEENWLGNTDAFSRLLADLNSRTAETTEEQEDTVTDSKKRANDDDEDNDGSDKKKRKKEKKDKKDKKDKKEKKEKKDKKDKKDKKEKKEKKEKKDKKDKVAEQETKESSPAVVRNAARAKFLRAKRMATQQDKARLNEILGVRSAVPA